MSKDVYGSTTKRTSSYVHNASSFPFQYKTLAQSLDELASQYPHYECYVFKGENKRYTYATWKHEIDWLATSLLELGFEIGDRLAVALPNCSENVLLSYVASKLGIIKVHLNPDSTGRELADAVNQTRCKGIVIASTDSALNILKQVVPDIDYESCPSVPTLKHIILIGSNQNALASIRNAHSYSALIEQGRKHSVRFETYSVKPETPLLIYLTSGSTGRPKAVLHTNFGVLNTIAMLRLIFGSYCVRYCAPQSMIHITTGTMGVLLPSTDPCTVIIPSLIINPEAIMQAIDNEKCTCMIVNPTLCRNILAHPNRHKYDLNSLQYLSVTGTSMQPEFLSMLEAELGIGRVEQAYGMTEIGNFLTCTVDADYDDDRRHTSIGRCLPHMEIKIVDNNGTVVPIGSEGEIWARGYSIMSCYDNDRERTAEMITDDRWLRTGDLARMDDDGYLFFIGRKKEMIIRGATNIYPMEIERVILEHPSVADVQVFSIPDPLVDEVVCAFVKLKPETKCEVDELKMFLSDKLTSYKIPEHIRFVDDFTRNIMGKVAKYKLAEEMINILNSS